MTDPGPKPVPRNDCKSTPEDKVEEEEEEEEDMDISIDSAFVQAAALTGNKKSQEIPTPNSSYSTPVRKTSAQPNGVTINMMDTGHRRKYR